MTLVFMISYHLYDIKYDITYDIMYDFICYIAYGIKHDIIYIWNLAKLQYRSQTTDIDIWTILNTKTSILTVSGLAWTSGTICNFDIEGLYFDIEVGMLRYWSTQKWRNIYIQGLYLDIEVPDIKESSILKFKFIYQYRRIFDIEVQIGAQQPRLVQGCWSQLLAAAQYSAHIAV